MKCTVRKLAVYNSQEKTERGLTMPGCASHSARHLRHFALRSTKLFRQIETPRQRQPLNFPVGNAARSTEKMSAGLIKYLPVCLRNRTDLRYEWELTHRSVARRNGRILFGGNIERFKTIQTRKI